MPEQAGYQPLPREVQDELEEMAPAELLSWVGSPEIESLVGYSLWMYRAHEAHKVSHDQFDAATELRDPAAAEDFYGTAGKIESDITYARLAYGITRYVEKNPERQLTGDNCFS